MKLIYKPFALIAGFIAVRVGRNLFKTLWAKIDDGKPPEPTAPHATLTKVVGAKALEAATMAGVAAAVDRASASFFHHLTGLWPGKDPEEK
jgi:hypothetical protein